MLFAPVAASAKTQHPGGHGRHRLARTHDRRGVHRRGGRVRRAWPHGGGAPRTPLERWLARQVGPLRALPCNRRHSKGHASCRRAHKASVALANTAAVELGSSTVTIPTASGGEKLALVRSYQIPPGDPSYTRLLNISWTYDSAVSAAAFVAAGAQAHAQQLLDQLAALQNTDGSIDYAFNVSTGEGTPLYRSGTIAWLGLAETSYDLTFHTNRYLASEKLAANYLLSLQGANGLIRGGPDVKWVSTQHNLIAYTFLVRLGSDLTQASAGSEAARYQAAAAQVAAGVDSNLLVLEGSTAYFREGLEDNIQSLDVQALGAAYLAGRGEGNLGELVLAHAQSAFALSGRSISLSLEPASYNETYSSPGPFTGYAPYIGSGAPNVLWFEGTAEMRLATAPYGQSTSTLEESMSRWEALTQSEDGAPLQSDQTVNDSAYGVEYHVWPAAAAAAWVILAQSNPKFFAAPLPPGTTQVTEWSKVRGGNLITTTSTGTVEMMTVGGERRVLAGSASGANYTVTTDATLYAGEGFGIWLRANKEASTAYSVQVDHSYNGGRIILRERQEEFELSGPLAEATPPPGFVWYGQPHLLSATIIGNTLTASIDGTQVLSASNLTAASVTAIKYSYGVTISIVPPVEGSYGLRAWGSSTVRFWQTTAGPPI